MEIISILHAPETPLGLDRLLSALKGADPLKTFLGELYCLDSGTIKTLSSSIKSQLSQLKSDFPEYKNAWDLCVYLSNLFPEDPGIFAPLFLNIVELNPGEAMYIPACVLHSYVKGMGIELMNNSDNVLRVGLTAKYKAKEEVLKILNFSEYEPEIMLAPAPESLLHRYPAPAGDFSLSVMHSGEGPTEFPVMGPSILLITEGAAAAAGNGMSLSKGESVFIPAGTKPVFSGTFTAYIAAASS
jgi:mannose-6-phosphate isomerase